MLRLRTAGMAEAVAVGYQSLQAADAGEVGPSATE